MKSSKSAPGYIQRSTKNNEQEIHCNCHLTFEAPAMKLPTRVCNKYEIRCSESWEDSEVKAQCEAYTARVCSERKTFRNRHCMLCNNLHVPEPCLHAYGGVLYESKPSLTKFVRWRTKTGVCASSEIYDKLFRVCSKLFI
jgi:hypothetical protein